MGYSVSEQLNLFSRLGIRLSRHKNLAQRLGIFLSAALPLLLLAGFLITRRKKDTEDKVAAYWLEFCQKLDDIGLARPPQQGPRDYMHFIRKQRPDLDASIREIVPLYISLRYSNHATDNDIKHLGKLVKHFLPRKQHPL